MHLIGLHSHVGSNIRDAESFVRGRRGDARIAAPRRAARPQPRGRPGVAYEPADEAPAARGLRRGSLLDAASAHAHLAPPHVSVEPGRSIAGPAGVTLYTVGEVKRVPGGPVFAAVDGGMSDNPRPALYGARYTVAAAGAGAPHVPGERTRTAR